MKFLADERAQSLQVGAILIFGMLVLTFTIYQAQGVPEENKHVEFEHSQEINDEMLEFYTAIFDTTISGDQQSVTIELGTEYNNRMFFIYPPPSSGFLETTEPNQIQIRNAIAVDDGITESFDNYWTNDTRSYTTRAITYESDYNELNGVAKYRIEHGVLAAQYEDITQLRNDELHQPIVDGTDIDIVLFDGDLQAIHPNTETVFPHRITDSSEVTITSDSQSELIELELHTGLPEESWNLSNPNSLLYEEPYVDDVEYEDDTVKIQLEDSVDFDLTINKVDISDGVSDPSPTYLKNKSYNGTESTFQIRTKYNDKVERGVGISVLNSTNEVTREVFVEDGEQTLSINEGDDECGVVMDGDVEDVESFERLNITDSCK